jgi:hypothetical protein
MLGDQVAQPVLTGDAEPYVRSGLGRPDVFRFARPAVAWGCAP